MEVPEGSYHAESFLSASQMAVAYKLAAVVISRGGANTIAELAATRKAVIMVPNRLMAAHQLINASRLEQAGAVVLLPEENLTTQSLVEAVGSLLGDSSRRHQIETEISKFNKPSAAIELAELILVEDDK